MARVHSGEEILPKGSTSRVACTNFTDRRQTDGETDRRIYDSKDPNVTQSHSGKNLPKLTYYALLLRRPRIVYVRWLKILPPI